MFSENLKFNRFLQKQPAQSEETKGAVFNILYPAPKRNSNQANTKGRVPGNEEDDGAPNVLTGTVITSCFIQTTALPSRIEMQGNDLTFYDDTYEEGGEVIGDTSKLVFTHDLNSGEGFILEKRASIHDTYDNVLSWYATPAKDGSVNYLYIGRDGRNSFPESRNLSYLELSSNIDTALPYDASRGPYNGAIGLNMYRDGALTNAAIQLYNDGTLNSGTTGITAAVIAAGDGSVSDAAVAFIGYADDIVGLERAFGVDKTGFVTVGLPTSSAGLPSGYLWSNAGVLTIVP